jgi:radical SAM protein with 4Fe4S-binding SPASM domain
MTDTLVAPEGTQTDSMALDQKLYGLKPGLTVTVYTQLPGFTWPHDESHDQEFAVVSDGCRTARLTSIALGLLRFLTTPRDLDALEQEYRRLGEIYKIDHAPLDRVLRHYVARKFIQPDVSDTDSVTLTEFTPTDWREGVYITPDMLTFVDERAIFSVAPYFVRNPRTGLTHYMDGPEMALTHFLKLPRSYDEIEQFYGDRLLPLACEEHPLGDLKEAFLAPMLREAVITLGPKAPERAELRPNIYVTHPPVEKTRILPRGFPETIALVPTQRCNNACRHCAVFKSDTDTYQDVMPLSLIHALIDEMHYNGLKILRITGGEPLVRKDIFEILQYAATKYFGIMLYTNGNLINAGNVELLRKITWEKEENFIIHLSLDGLQEGHDWFRRRKGAFARTVNAMRLLQNREIPYYVEMTVHPRMMDEFTEAAEVVMRHGSRALLIHPAIGIGRGIQHSDDIHMDLPAIRELWEKVKALKEKHPHFDARLTSFELPDAGFKDPIPASPEEADVQQCAETRESAQDAPHPPNRRSHAIRNREGQCTAGKDQLIINYNGDVLPCPNWVTIDVPPIGNVFTNSIANIWRYPGKWGASRGDWDYKDIMVCRDCGHLNRCELGKLCRIPSMLWFGTPYGPPPSCILNYEALGISTETVQAFHETVKDTSSPDFDWGSIVERSAS